MSRTDAAVSPIQFVLRVVLAVAVALLALPLFLNTPAFAEGEDAPPPAETSQEEAPPQGEPASEAEPESDGGGSEPAPQPEQPAEEPPAQEPSEPEVQQPEAEEPESSVDTSDVKPTTSTSAGKGLAAGADQLAAMLVTDPINCANQTGTNLNTGKVNGFNQNTQENAGGSWINGALNQNNSNYAENDFVPHRVLLDNIQPGLNQLVVSYDMTKNTKYAYDFLDHLAIDEPGATISWDAPAGNPPVPLPSYDNNDGTATVVVTITFDVPDGTDGEMIIRFDSHIASELDYGPNSGAGSISGAPYHVALGTLNCASAGNQDNQLMSDAVDAGTITIQKNAEPNSPQDFEFSIVPGGAASQFFLDDDADGTLPNSATFHVAPGVYDATEINLPPGWDLVGISCVEAGGNSSATNLPQHKVSITVVDNGTTTCTFSNGVVQPELTLVKVVVNGNTGGTAVASDWTLSADGPTDFSGAGNGPAVTDQTVQAGSYDLSESGGPVGYTPSDWVCTGGNQVDGDTVQLANGDDVVCTITNTAQAAQLTLVKVVDNGDTGADAEPGDWTLSADGPTDFSGAGNSAAVTDVPVQVGSYDLSETGGPAGYDASDWVCTGGAQDDADTVTIGLGQDVTCTITNTAQQPELTLVKVVDNGDTGADAEPGDWTLSADGPTDFSGAGDSQTIVDVPVQVGSYDLSETGGPAGYDASAWDCTGGAQDDADTVTIGLGDDVVCTITNTAQTAGLTLVKVVENGNTGADNEASDWTLTADGPTLVSGAGGSTDVVDQPVAVGTYDLSEAGPDGYDASDWVCTGGTQDDADTVTIGLGQDVTCTITNTAQQPELTLVKVVDNGDTGADNEFSDWTLTADGPTQVSGAGGSVDVIDVPVAIGLYDLSESGPAGYNASAWDCTGGDQVDADTVEIGLGDDVVCIVTNTAVTPTLTLVKDVDHNGTGDDAVDTDFTLTATGPETISGEEGDSEITGAGVPIGTYELTEVATVAGYELVEWVCSGDATVDHDDNGTPDNPADDTWSVELGLSDDVTCEAFNRAIPSDWIVEKSSDPVSGSTVEPGDEIQYTVTVTRVGDGVNVFDIDVIDTLTGIDMAWISDLQVSGNASAVPGAGIITLHINELSDTVVMTYTVTVGEVWGAELKNVVTPGTQPCVDPDPQDPFLECDETTHFTPHWVLDKSVELLGTPGDDDGLAEPGERLTYTLELTNDTEHATVEDVQVTDDLSDVLDNATMVDSLAELAGKGLTLVGTDLTWTVAGPVAPGETVSVSYTVQIDEHQFDVTLRNIATPGNGGDCVAPGECETETVTPPVTTMVIEKQDFETGEVLAGAEFALYADNAPDDVDAIGAEDVLIDTAVTDATGQVKFDELQKGEYLVVETSPPAGYTLPDNPVLQVTIDDGNFVRGGEMTPIVFRDPTTGQIAIVAKQQFESIDGEWVESDGLVNFGDLVKYVVRVEATGPKNFYNVEVSDYVPGFNPADTTSTTQATLVENSAACTGELTCTVTVGADGLVTFEIGDVFPGNGETVGGAIEFVIAFPQAPDDPVFVDGLYTDMLWNEGYLDYDEVVGGTPEVDERAGKARAKELVFEHHSLTSNEVVVSAELEEEPIDPTPPLTPPNLPDTGAQAWLSQLAVLGGLVLALGVALAARNRRKAEQQAA